MSDTVAVDNQVIQAGRAKLADKYEKRLKAIAILVRRIEERPTTMGSDDMDDLAAIDNRTRIDS